MKNYWKKIEVEPSNQAIKKLTLSKICTILFIRVQIARWLCVYPALWGEREIERERERMAPFSAPWLEAQPIYILWKTWLMILNLSSFCLGAKRSLLSFDFSEGKIAPFIIEPNYPDRILNLWISRIKPVDWEVQRHSPSFPYWLFIRL